MSIEIVLVPLAMAAFSAWQAGRREVDSEGRAVCLVQTRMRDEGLLAAALRDTRAQVTRQPDALTATWQGVQAEFNRDPEGVWQAHFVGEADLERASEIVAAIDVFYGRQVQQAVLTRLRQRAQGAGMSIASERVEEDQSVTMLLEVGVRQ